MKILKALWAWWKPIAHRIGTFQARIILTLFYFVLLLPFAVGMRLLSDPLSLKVRSGTQWVPRLVDNTDALAIARRQF